MALHDDVERIRDKALAALDDAHDYFSYTRDAWRTLQQPVSREGLTFTWRNHSTNSIVSEQDALSRAQRYAAVELSLSSLQQFVSIFENVLSDVIRAWLLVYPAQLSKRHISGRDIIGAIDKAAIVEALVEKELREVFYDRPANWFKDLSDLSGIKLPSGDDIDSFAEVKATRDVFVHGHGIANSYYLDKAGNFARAGAGHLLDIPDPYHQASWQLIRRLVQEIGDAIAARAR